MAPLTKPPGPSTTRSTRASSARSPPTRGPRLPTSRRAVGLSVSAVQTRLRRLETRGVITGYRALVEPAAVGKPLAAFVEITPLDPRQPDNAPELLEHLAEIEACHSIAGDASYILFVRVASPRHLEGTDPRHPQRRLGQHAHHRRTPDLLREPPDPPRLTPQPEDPNPRDRDRLGTIDQRARPGGVRVGAARVQEREEGQPVRALVQVERGHQYGVALARRLGEDPAVRVGDERRAVEVCCGPRRPSGSART
jgi:hypothetical protein